MCIWRRRTTVVLKRWVDRSNPRFNLLRGSLRFLWRNRGECNRRPGISTAFVPDHALLREAACYDLKSLSDIDEAHFHHIFNTNVLGLLTTTRVAVANFNSVRARSA